MEDGGPRVKVVRDSNLWETAVRDNEKGKGKLHEKGWWTQTQTYAKQQSKTSEKVKKIMGDSSQSFMKKGERLKLWKRGVKA